MLLRKRQGRILTIRDDVMNIPQRNPAIRQGQFLWMDESARKKYLSSLKKKIEEGYFYSEKVVSRIVEEIAPVIHDVIDQDAMQ